MYSWKSDYWSAFWFKKIAIYLKQIYFFKSENNKRLKHFIPTNKNSNQRKFGMQEYFCFLQDNYSSVLEIVANQITRRTYNGMNKTNIGNLQFSGRRDFLFWIWTFFLWIRKFIYWRACNFPSLKNVYIFFIFEMSDIL